MARTMVVVVLLLFLVSLAGTGAHGVVGAAGTGPFDPPEPVDFVRFNDNVYEPYPLSINHLPDEAIGPQVGQVTNNEVDLIVQLEEPEAPCFWDAPDGTAPMLALGTPIYAVHGYSTAFRLAIRSDEGIVLYEAVCSDWAKVGADLFDVRGRVMRIDIAKTEVRNAVQQPQLFASLTDRAMTERIVDLLLAAPIGESPSRGEVGPPVYAWYLLTFELDDGTESVIEFWRHERTGVKLGRGGVSVPEEFGAILDRALQQQNAASSRG